MHFWGTGEREQIYLGIIAGFVGAVDTISEMYKISPIWEKGILSFCVLGLTLSLLFLAGVFLENIFLCVPWAAYSAFTVIMDFLGLVYTSTFGLPLVHANESKGKILTYSVWYLLFALHIYFLWVVVIYVKQLCGGMGGNYEQFPQGDSSPASSRDFLSRSRQSRRSGRSPIFKIRTSNEY